MTNNTNVVAWFEIYVEDMERAKKFYESVFAIKLENLKNDLNELELWSFPGNPNNPGCNGALVKIPGMKPNGFNTIVYFSSEDCLIQEQRVKENGGTVEKTKQSIGEYGFITMAKDTEGNTFGIHSLK